MFYVKVKACKSNLLHFVDCWMVLVQTTDWSRKCTKGSAVVNRSCENSCEGIAESIHFNE